MTSESYKEKVLLEAIAEHSKAPDFADWMLERMKEHAIEKGVTLEAYIQAWLDQDEESK